MSINKASKSIFGLIGGCEFFLLSFEKIYALFLIFYEEIYLLFLKKLSIF